ncbi:MAG: signal peptide peptidase SppA [Chloroflexota bacterium]
MSDSKEQADFFTELGREIKEGWQSLRDGYGAFTVSLRNQIRQAQGAKLDYVIMPIGGSLPERAEPPRSFVERQLPLPPPPMSMERLNRRLQAIADAGNVKGVLFLFRGFAAGLAKLQSFRQAIERLQAAGKEVIIFTPYLNLPHFYAAAAADKIIVPPSTQFEVLGLRSEIAFYKDALARVGVEVDVVQISPYKSAYDPFDKAEMTPEFQAQIDWLLDDQFDMLTADMAKGRSTNGRSLPQETLYQLINQGPLSATAALEAGLIDHIAYEDELAFLLADVDEEADADKEETAVSDSTTTTETDETVTRVATRATTDEDEQPKASLKTWDEAAGQLLEKWRRRSKKFIGVISLEGAIMMGSSRQPPIDLPIPFIGGSSAGEATLIQLLRQAEEMDNMAALIFHVDSPGGSALASDLIGREVARLAQKKPVLAYMGNVAASGGYYVSAPAQHIMAQPGTTTGSIGVIIARPSTGGLYNQLSVNRVQIKRGEHASLYSDMAPMSDAERQIFWDGILENYVQFKEVVANGRSLPIDELDPICEGRVWTGRQALEHKLVDSHGDFVEAVRCAAQLADLPTDDNHAIRVVNIHLKASSYLPPKPFEAAEEIGRWVFGDRIRALSGQPLYLLPFQIDI